MESTQGKTTAAAVPLHYGGEGPAAPREFTVDFSRNPRYMLGRVPLLGVTDVLRDNGLINTQFMTRKGRDRGAAVHYACHLVDTPEQGAFNWSSLHPDLHGYVHSWEKLKARIAGFRILDSERALFDPLMLIAGTLDRRVFFDGSEHVWDLKTGTAPRSGGYQTGAYDRMLPPYACGMRRRAAIELHQDGTIATIRKHEDMNDANYFLAMVATTRARQQVGVSFIDPITGEAKWKTE